MASDNVNGNGHSNGKGRKKKDVRGRIGPDGLTDKQRAFVAAFVGEACGDAVEALKLAGYRPGDENHQTAITAFRVLQAPAVQQAIAWHAAQRGLSSDNAKLALADIAQADMNNFLSIDEDGNAHLDFLRAAGRGALTQIKKYKERRSAGADGQEVVTREIELHSRLPALELILRMNGMLVEKHEHLVISETPDPIITDPELNRLANEYERRMASLSGRDGQSPN